MAISGENSFIALVIPLLPGIPQNSDLLPLDAYE
jgi:hypothetical protein